LHLRGSGNAARVTPSEEHSLSTADAFLSTYGGKPDGIWCAPGRVNLMGDHTDYNEGFVLPLAIDLECRVAGRRREDGRIRVVSRQAGDGGTCELAVRRTEGLSGWARYVAGVAWALVDAGVPIPGADLLVDSDVPGGAGLASSAALACASGLALCGLAGEQPDPVLLALAGQRGETETVGAPVGVMDLVAAVLGSACGPVLLDCRSLEHRPVPWDVDGSEVRVLAIDTRVAHAHALGEYAVRRAECEQAAAALGVASLRDVTERELERADLPDVLRRRARHVVTENARVLATEEVLLHGRLEELGPVFADSHVSLRDDFEVSCRELDMAVESAVLGGAVAARMTGGGFGGSAVALVPRERVADVESACVEAATAAGAPLPVIRVVGPVGGARRCA
jgi:galactokinase